MTLQDLGKILNEMYNNSQEGEAVAMIHLFGIKYADQIKELSVSKKSIAIAAGLGDSYATEISKGVKLSKYVNIK